jgi:hypothetical protein
LIRATNRGARRRSVRVTAAAPRPANDYAVFAGQRGHRRRHGRLRRAATRRVAAVGEPRSERGGQADCHRGGKGPAAIH